MTWIVPIFFLGAPAPLQAQSGNEAAVQQASPHAAAMGEQEKKDAAKKLFLEGVAFFEKKEYEEALAKFLESYDILPHWQIRFNVATCHFYLGKKAEALSELLEFLQEAGPEISEQQKKETNKYIDSIRKEIASVKFPGLKPGDEILVDGQPPKWSPYEQILFLEPGTHHVMIKRGDDTLLDEDLTCTAGQEKEIHLYVKEKTVNLPVAPDGGEGTGAGKKAGGKSSLVVAGWAMTGLAAVLLAGGSVTGVLALTENNKIGDLESLYEAASELEKPAIESEANDRYDKAMDLARASTVLFAVGGAAALTAIILLVVGKKIEKREVGKKNLSLGISPAGPSLGCSF